MNLANDPRIYGGVEPVNPLQLKKLEIERLKDIAYFKRLESERRRHWNYLWLDLVGKYPKDASLPVPRTASDALRKYEELRKKIISLPPLESRYLEDLKRAETYRGKKETIEKQRLPSIKKQKHHHEYFDDLHSKNVEKDVSTETPQYMDHDERYLTLLNANPTVVKLRQKHAYLMLVSTLAQRESDGSLVLNPRFKEHFEELDTKEDSFTIEEAVGAQFMKAFPEAALLYNENEKRRIYDDPETDPALQRIQRQEERKIQEAINQKQIEKTRAEMQKGKKVYGKLSLTQEEKTTVAEKIRHDELLDFARSFPQKAAVYAEKDDAIAQAWKEYEVEVKLKEQKLNAATYERIIKKNIEAIPVTSSSTQEPQTPETYKIVNLRRSMPTFLGRSTSASGTEQPPQQYENQPGEKQPSPAHQPSTPSRSQRNIPAPSATSAQTTQKAIKAVSWLMRLATPPGVYVVIFLLIILIIIILFMLIGGSEQKKNPDGENAYSISITKTGPTAVPNPEESDITKEDVSDITYDIAVTYPGAADKIVVTDPLDDNAVFISAGGPGNPTYEQSTHTVTWNITSGPQARLTPSSNLANVSLGALSSLRFPQTVYAQSEDSGYNQESFSREGLPAPQNPNPVILDSEALKLWKDYFMDDAVKAAEKVGIDVGWVGFWPFYEGINFNTTFSNCNEDADRFNPSKECASDSWQVGPGVRPFDLPNSALQEAFDAMYGNHDPETIQRVGQQIIDQMKVRHNTELTYPASTFPNVTIEELTRMETPEMRQWFVHLTRDDAIGMYYIAKLFKGHVDDPEEMSTRMCGWGACRTGEHYDPQRTSNYISAVYDAGLSGGDGSNSGFGTIPLTLTVRPKTSNSWVINKAYAEVIGARNSLPGSTPGIGKPGQPLPSNDIAEIKQVLCDDYKVCPTEVILADQAPSSDWTLPQLTALWNVVQRIYESDTYKTLAIGNYPLEITRAKCYPLAPGCDGTYGYYAGQGSQDWHRDPSSRLIVITDLFASSESNPTRLEWLFAHEIGHSASGGDSAGGLTPELGMNEPYKAVLDCSQQVSTYGGKDVNENNSEILAYYMTAAEESNDDYLGSSTNLKTDFPCTYNAVKDNYFDGVEF